MSSIFGLSRGNIRADCQPWNRLELNDDIEQAAFYGLFLGGIEHSIKILTASESASPVLQGVFPC
jgi:hypothetical protein